MAAHWWWTWSIGLPATDYSTAGFTVSSTSNIITNNTTSLFTPVLGSISPSEEFHMRAQGTATIVTPVFSTVDQGWLIFRWANLTNSNLSPSGRIIEIMNSSVNVVFDLRVDSNSHTPFIQLYVDNSLVGTSIRACHPGRYYVFALDFDFTQTPPQIGLTINGIREISMGGFGSQTFFDRIRFSSGGTGGTQTTFGDFIVFNSLADLNEKSSQDVWITFLDPDSATDGDNSWTPSAGTDLTAVNDADSTTYTETSTSPDSITYGFESCNTRQSGWNPSVVYGLATIALASANTSQTNTTIDLIDAVPASAGSLNLTLTSTAIFLGVWTADDSANNPWTQSSIDNSTIIYSVA